MLPRSAPDEPAMGHGCCAPTVARVGSVPVAILGDAASAAFGLETPAGRTTEASAAGQPELDVVRLEGETFRMGNPRGDGYPADGEVPVHEVHLDQFSIAATTVTNGEFGAFVEATGHVTEAERFGWLFVFAGLLPDDFEPTAAVASAPWWRQVFGAGRPGSLIA